MRRPVLQITDLGKMYQLGEFGNRTFWNKSKTKDFIWALRGVQFEVRQGEVLGIIGSNGAGKSTLLKLLAQITEPSEGRIRVKGRIASLLEVGTGMHPDLTGRENIYLNGAILGMSKPEINSKFDQIVDFSGCRNFIDTPLKRYSSGMKVRIGFSVAAHLESEIIIVDEVLAVGDAEFQSKAIAKISELTKDSKRTVLFVSHSMAAIRSLCDRCIYLKNGELEFDGDVETAIAKYLGYDSGQASLRKSWVKDFLGNNFLEFRSAAALQEGSNSWLNAELAFSLRFEVNLLLAEAMDCTVQFCSMEGDVIAVTSTLQKNVSIPKRDGIVTYHLQAPAQMFNEKEYRLNVLFVKDKRHVVWRFDDVLRLSFVGTKRSSDQWMGQAKGHLLPHWNWKVD